MQINERRLKLSSIEKDIINTMDHESAHGLEFKLLFIDNPTLEWAVRQINLTDLTEKN